MPRRSREPGPLAQGNSATLGFKPRIKGTTNDSHDSLNTTEHMHAMLELILGEFSNIP